MPLFFIAWVNNVFAPHSETKVPPVTPVNTAYVGWPVKSAF